MATQSTAPTIARREAWPRLIARLTQLARGTARLVLASASFLTVGGQPAAVTRKAMAVTDHRKRVLFLCTHNSARSQMAEGWLRYVAGDRFEVVSAGTEATRVRPQAVKAMAEAGVDISRHESKALDRYLAQSWDFVITVCDQANEACPLFPGGKRRLHWSFPDPSRATGSEDEQLAVYRRVRDAIRERIRDFVEQLAREEEPHE